MKNLVSWFEIPTLDIDRAQKFYETIFEIQMVNVDTPHIQMRMFPSDSPMNAGGALTYNKDIYKPSSSDGALIYLNGNPDVQIILDRIPAAGGTIIVPKKEISPDHGFFAIFIDTEGNRIALRSVPAYI